MADPYTDFDNWDRDQNEKMERLPECCCCGNKITQETAVCVDGDLFCDDCEDEAWQKVREDYVESIDD